MSEDSSEAGSPSNSTSATLCWPQSGFCNSSAASARSRLSMARIPRLSLLPAVLAVAPSRVLLFPAQKAAAVPALALARAPVLALRRRPNTLPLPLAAPPRCRPYSESSSSSTGPDRRSGAGSSAESSGRGGGGGTGNMSSEPGQTLPTPTPTPRPSLPRTATQDDPDHDPFGDMFRNAWEPGSKRAKSPKPAAASAPATTPTTTTNLASTSASTPTTITSSSAATSLSTPTTAVSPSQRPLPASLSADKSHAWIHEDPSTDYYDSSPYPARVPPRLGLSAADGMSTSSPGIVRPSYYSFTAPSSPSTSSAAPPPPSSSTITGLKLPQHAVATAARIPSLSSRQGQTEDAMKTMDELLDMPKSPEPKDDAALKEGLDVPLAPPVRAKPLTGRTIHVQGTTDPVMAIRSVNRLVRLEGLRKLVRQQRFHERPGLKKKRLRSERWRARFKKAFSATTRRVQELTNQGW